MNKARGKNQAAVEPLTAGRMEKAHSLESNPSSNFSTAETSVVTLNGPSAPQGAQPPNASPKKKKSLSKVKAVGGFFGVVKDKANSNATDWKRQFEKRAMVGSLGFKVKNLLPDQKKITAESAEFKLLQTKVDAIGDRIRQRETQINNLSLIDEPGGVARSKLGAPKPSDLLYNDDGRNYYRQLVEQEKLRTKQNLDRRKAEIETDILREKKILQQALATTNDMKKFSDASFLSDDDDPKNLQDQTLDVMNQFLNPETKLKVPKGAEYDMVKKQVRERKTNVYTPWFIYIISGIQVIAFIALVSAGSITEVGLEPELKFYKNIRTFKGVETLEHWETKNIWVGPSVKFLIAAGAAYAPCMREDKGITEILWANYSFQDIGCCEFESRVTAGTTTEQECEDFTGGSAVWTNGLLCSERNEVTNPTPQIIRPCCYGIRGQCKMTSKQHCEVLNGYFNAEGPEHCSQVNCLSSICGFGGTKAQEDKPYLPEKPDQFYRLAFSIIYNQGFIQIVISVGSQIIVGRPIEKFAGHLRVGIVYLVSGVMGLFFGCTMSPYAPHIGQLGAISGLYAVTYLELIQSWSIIANRKMELLRITLAMAFFMFTATFPLVDMFVLFSGFIYGLCVGIAVLPYITFGEQQAKLRKMLMAVMIPILIAMIVVHFVVFYVVQPFTPEGCVGGCEFVNCIPYTEYICLGNKLW